MRQLVYLAVSLALAMPAGAAFSQTMYKCVGADGKTSYADLPCSGKVAAKKEIDVRANLDDVERANRKKEEKLRREMEEGEYDSRRASLGADEQAKKMEREIRLQEGSELDRRLDAYEQMKADTQKRVKADEEARAEASRLWHCRRGKEPEKCK
jgi:hypothetical protein